MKKVQGDAQGATLSEKQLQKLKTFQAEMQKAQSEIGSIEIQMDMLKSRKENAFRSIYENQAKMSEFMKEIEEEFGSGSVDINTGVFTPSSESKS